MSGSSSKASSVTSSGPPSPRSVTEDERSVIKAGVVVDDDVVQLVDTKSLARLRSMQSSLNRLAVGDIQVDSTFDTDLLEDGDVITDSKGNSYVFARDDDESQSGSSCSGSGSEEFDEDESTDDEVDDETYQLRCPTLDEFKGLRAPRVKSILSAEKYLTKKPADFLNVMRQTKQIQYKIVTERARDNTGWIAKLYVTWCRHKYAIASHFHAKKASAKSAVTKAFQIMARAVVWGNSFKGVDRLVAYYVYAKIPDATSMFEQDCAI